MIHIERTVSLFKKLVYTKAKSLSFDAISIRYIKHRQSYGLIHT